MHRNICRKICVAFIIIIQVATLRIRLYAQCSGINFSAGSTTGCALFSTKFTVTGTPSGTTFGWDLGKGILTGKKDTITGVYSKAGKYSIIMIAHLPGGDSCVVTKNNYIVVTPPIVPVVYADPGYVLCNPADYITLTDSTPGITGREWIIDGHSYKTQKISYKFGSIGTKPLSLKLSNNNGCATYFVKNIVINDTVAVDFCADFTVTDTATTGIYTAVTGSSPGRTVKQYIWAFPGGSPATSGSQNPFVTYHDKKEHDVSLTIVMSDGCTYTQTRKSFAGNFVQPSLLKICKNYPQSFSINGLNKGQDSIGWSFPGSAYNVKTGPTAVSVSYDQSGDYGMSVVMRYKDNPARPACTVKVTYPHIVTILGPNASFSSNDNYTCNPKDTIHLINGTNTFGAPNVKYTWYFLDSSGKLLKKNYKIGPSGRPDTIKYVPGRYGSISVALVATSSNGCRDSVLQQSFIFVNRPKVDFSTKNKFGCYGGYYDLTATTIPVDTPISHFDFSWILQSVSDTSIIKNLDGKTAEPWKGYDYLPDDYNVTLIVKVGEKCSVKVTKPAFVKIIGDDTYFTVSKKTGCAGMTTHVETGSEKINPPNASVAYRWTVSPPAGVAIDSATSRAANITFNAHGTYKITLTTTVIGNNDTCTTVYSQDNAVTVGMNLSCKVNTRKCLGDTTDVITLADNDIYNFKWKAAPRQFARILPGDTSRNIRIIFYKDTCYTITVSGKRNIDGSVCTDSASTKVCYNLPAPSFYTVSPTLYCAPATAKFVNTTTGKSKYYLWDFGDGNTFYTSTMDTMVYTYLKFLKGDYDVKLTAFDSLGCGATNDEKKIIHITGPVPYFKVNSAKGCDSLTVSFTNQSHNVSRFYFFNDDGGSADSVNLPSHTYKLGDPTLDSMTFHPVLQSKNDIFCPAFYFDTITIYKTPSVSVGRDQAKGCAPFTVHFSATSSNAQTWKWDFDNDGIIDDSVDQNPVFVFTRPGHYRPKLIVENGRSCPVSAYTDSVIVYPDARASFIPSDPSFCGKKEISFVNRSSGFNHFFFSYGDGTPADSDVMVKHRYFFDPAKTALDSEVFYPHVKLYSDGGCTDSSSDTITAFRMPVAGFKSSVVSGCSPLTVKFTDTSTAGYISEWDFDNDGTIDTTGKTVYHTYYPGLYTVKLLSVSKHHCVDSVVKVNLVTVSAVPRPDFAVSDTDGCIHLPVTFFNRSVSDSPVVKWAWNFNDTATKNDTSSLENPVYSFQTKGYHTVTLKATGNTGCTGAISKKIIYIEDSVPPKNTSLLFVTVEDSNAVKIVWQKSQARLVTGYRINQLAGGRPFVIHNTQDISDTSFIYSDTALNTSGSQYCFSVQAVNKCNRVSFASFGQCTILLTDTAQPGPANILNWTSYYGWAPDRYRIYRSTKGSAFLQIDSVPGNVLTYKDSGLCDENYCYFVEAVNDSSGFKSRSNIVCLQAQYVKQAQPVNLKYVTVKNSSLYLAWDTAFSSGIQGYAIDKYAPQSGWINNYATTTANDITDTAVDVNAESYNYRIRVTDKCGYSGLASNTGSSILLKQSLAGYSIRLVWNAYRHWPDGVKNYQIQISGKKGIFYPVATLSDTSYTDDSVYNSIDTAYCYRVVAHEGGNRTDSSLSNLTCAVLPARIFVPNAFTPGNGDSLNNVWKVSAISIYNVTGSTLYGFHTRVFNRWGTLVFESNDINKGWDGNFKGKKAPSGVYIYLIDAEGINGKNIHLKGNVTILR